LGVCIGLDIGRYFGFGRPNGVNRVGRKSFPKPVAGLVETVGEQLTKVLGESTQVEITKAGGVESAESFY